MPEPPEIVISIGRIEVRARRAGAAEAAEARQRPAMTRLSDYLGRRGGGMSNVLAIAAVTQLLKDLLNDALINGDVGQALGADFSVTALPPDRVVAENARRADPAAQPLPAPGHAERRAPQPDLPTARRERPARRGRGWRSTCTTC